MAVVEEASEGGRRIGFVDVDVLEERCGGDSENVEDEDERDCDVDDLWHGVNDGFEEAVETGASTNDAEKTENADDGEESSADAGEEDVKEGS